MAKLVVGKAAEAEYAAAADWRGTREAIHGDAG